MVRGKKEEKKNKWKEKRMKRIKVEIRKEE